MLYLVERGDKYRNLTLGGTFTTPVPAHAVIDYTRSDRFFISGEAEDKLLLSELESSPTTASSTRPTCHMKRAGTAREQR